MNHDWLLFLIMAQLLLSESERKLKRGEWMAGVDAFFALASLIVGVLHVFGVVHD
ncbi:hypothetical protein LCGC14_0849910 [marine sediment metagenome]|uniref:Uncharacterized protein n=1 Tax=marine sediment metagenome TaxID=412755 RepID=A0A0F9RVF9_9ZZZZ